MPNQRWRRPGVLKRIATIDLETDPFRYGREPKPFAAGFYDGSLFKYWWGASCVDQLLAFLATRDEPLLIYAHNGGKFDYLFMLPIVLKSPKTFFLKTRLVSWQFGHHELRDSFAIFPEALGKLGNKRAIDITKLEKENRERHKFEIIRYMERDCTLLHELVTAFVGEFGAKLTVGSAALTELKKLHKYSRMSVGQDGYIRDDFFHGGHVEAFKPAGIYRGNWKVYDVNSMYAYVMRSFKHPVTRYYYHDRKITKNTVFLTVECFSRGAFGAFDQEGDFCFPEQHGRWHTTIHEFRAARRLGLIDRPKIIRTIDFPQRSTFAAFVDHFYAQRQEAKTRGDTIFDQLYKRILNSSFGKTGINPREFYDVKIASPLTPYIGKEWSLVEKSQLANVFQRPLDHEKDRLWKNYENVAIAASITGAARAVLIEARAKAINPAYCDTDSLICESLPADMLHPSRLGAWKLELEAAELVIVGKKTYGLRSAEGELLNYAAKGVNLDDLVDPSRRATKADGDALKWQFLCNAAQGIPQTLGRNAPTMRRSGKIDFQKRTIKATSFSNNTIGLPLHQWDDAVENSPMPENEEE